MQGHGRPGPPLYMSVRSFITDAHHNRLLAVPAFLYAVNNSLKFSMQLFFKPTTTKMLGNLKVRAGGGGKLHHRWPALVILCLVILCGVPSAPNPLLRKMYYIVYTILYQITVAVGHWYVQRDEHVWRDHCVPMHAHAQIFTIAILMKLVMKRTFNVIQVGLLPLLLLLLPSPLASCAVEQLSMRPCDLT